MRLWGAAVSEWEPPPQLVITQVAMHLKPYTGTAGLRQSVCLCYYERDKFSHCSHDLTYTYTYL